MPWSSFIKNHREPRDEKKFVFAKHSAKGLSAKQSVWPWRKKDLRLFIPRSSLGKSPVNMESIKNISKGKLEWKCKIIVPELHYCTYVGGWKGKARQCEESNGGESKTKWTLDVDRAGLQTEENIFFQPLDNTIRLASIGFTQWAD